MLKQGKYYTTGLIALLILLLPVISHAQFYNGSYQQFGKNRLQFREFLWTYYQYDQFNIYFYAGGKNVAGYAAKTADATIKELEDIFDFYIEGKIDFILYNDINDFRQSNIGLVDDDDYNIGGVTRIVGSKLFVYFEGDHRKLQRQIRAGVANIAINQMMYGDNWREMLKNSTLLTLPDWYINGLVSYAAEPWSIESDNRVRDGVMSGRYEKFNRLEGEDASYAGHALWYYIAQVYGDKVIPNVLYMARVSRNIESGFLFVLGVSLNTLVEESLRYYRKKYELENESAKMPEEDPLSVRIKKSAIYSQLKISPDGKKAAYVTNELGQYRIWLYDLETGKRKKILKKGHKLDRINDLNYPLLNWHPSGEVLTFISEDKGQVYLNFYTIEDKKLTKKPMFKFQRILDYSYLDNGAEIVISAIVNGQSDIFIYKIAAGVEEKITDDLYDDRYPAFLQNSKQIIFSSNRMDDTLRSAPEISHKDLSKKYNLFIYDYAGKSPVLRRVTDNVNINETQPVSFDKDHFSWLSDENGVINRYVGHFDSVISHIDTTFHYRYITKSLPITNYSRNIKEHHLNPENGKYSEIIYHNGKHRLYINPIPYSSVKGSTAAMEIQNTPFREKEIVKASEKEKAVENEEDESKPAVRYTTIERIDTLPDNSSDYIDIDHYTFEELEEETPEDSEENTRFIKINPKDDDQDQPDQSEEEGEEKEEDEFFLPSQRDYHLSFTASDIISQMDFNYTNDIYQRFNGGPYINPGLGTVFKINMLDLFENYKIEGGFRYSFGNNGTEFYLSLDDRSQRLNKKYLLQRQSMTTSASGRRFSLQKIFTHQGTYAVKWPFNEVTAIRATSLLRNDQVVSLSTDLPNLETPDVFNTWGGLKIEYIFDNVLDKGTNLYNGTRYKIFAEYYREIGVPEGDIKIIGLDFRHYQKIHRDLIWAFRMAASTSLGSRKLVYYLGSVDNWIVLSDRPRFDMETNISSKENYYFQAIATNMRGFIQNTRNGNSFALINNEMRFPLVRYLSNNPIKSDFLYNFQIIGFTDIGTAWTGDNPYSDENAFNIKTIHRNPLKITLKNQKDPIVWSYGGGVRSKLWGYFVRLDYAWGVEDGIVLKPMTHFSLGLDF